MPVQYTAGEELSPANTGLVILFFTLYGSGINSTAQEKPRLPDWDHYLYWMPINCIAWNDLL